MRTGLVLLIALLLAACALQDVPLTPPPPITLIPEATPVFSGSCEETRQLEAWLQSASFGRIDFMTLLEQSRDLQRGEALYDNILLMIGRRDQLSKTPAPDCAVEAHLVLLDAMAKAIRAFARYNNGEAVDLRAAADDAEKRLQMAGVIEVELVERLEQQYENQQ